MNSFNIPSRRGNVFSPILQITFQPFQPASSDSQVIHKPYNSISLLRSASFFVSCSMHVIISAIFAYSIILFPINHHPSIIHDHTSCIASSASATGLCVVFSWFSKSATSCCSISKWRRCLASSLSCTSRTATLYVEGSSLECDRYQQ